MKTQVTLFTCAFALSFSIATAQITAPAIEWQNTIGGSTADYLHAIQQTTDGGYILGGFSQSGISGDKTDTSLGSYDYWVVKINSTGDIEWQKTIGGNEYDQLHSIQQTSDSGYILGGNSKSGISGDKTEASLGANDYWVVKLNSSGEIEWQNTIGGTDEDYLYAIQQTFDGGFILGGHSYSGLSGDKTEENAGPSYTPDYWVVKLNGSGEIEWQNTVGGYFYDYLRSIQQTSDGGYILGGDSQSGISGDKTEANLGGSDYWVVKLNSSGGIEWQNTIGGSNSETLQSVRQTSDGSYILGGSSSSGISFDKTEANLGGSDYWVVKINGAGEIEWQNTIGGSSDDDLICVQQTADGGYITGGTSFSGISDNKTEASSGASDYWVLKLNSSGRIEWQNTIGGGGHDDLHSVQQTAEGGYIIGGESECMFYIQGDKSEPGIGSRDYWVVKLSSDSCLSPINLSVANITATSAKLNWNSVPGAQGYVLRYKVAGTGEWTKKNTSSISKTIIENLLPDTKYIWQVRTLCESSPKVLSEWSEKQTFTTGILKLEAAGGEATLDIYPNPFTSSATISFSLQHDARVQIGLYDVAGEKLQTLFDENAAAGHHVLNLNRDELNAGIYFLKMRVNESELMKKLLIQ